MCAVLVENLVEREGLGPLSAGVADMNVSVGRAGDNHASVSFRVVSGSENVFNSLERWVKYLART